MSAFSADLAVILPELLLAVMGMVLLLWGAFRGNRDFGVITVAAALLMFAAAALAIVAPTGNGFNSLFVNDAFARFSKVVIFAGSGVATLMALTFSADTFRRFEMPVLMVYAATGLSVMASSQDLMTVYLGIELSSLSAYVLAALRRDNLRASEAGLKYFVLGALSSGILLYGMSLVYGYAGGTSFEAVAAGIAGEPSFGLIIGLVFLMAGLAFKISAAPFHMWTPDVYQGAPTPVTAFLATASKMGAFALVIRVMLEPFADIADSWRQIVILLAVVSMVWGSLAAIWQSNIKRLMAYSSIGHMGFALVGVAAGSEAGVAGCLVYLATYVIMNLGAFALILSMKRGGEPVEAISDLAGLSRERLPMALALLVIFFSMAGIPPLAGFFGKFLVFTAAVEAGFWWLAVIGLLTSVISAFYYIRIIKVAFFDDLPEEGTFDDAGFTLRVVYGLSALSVLLFIVVVSFVVGWANTAAGVFA
ncbi:MAG TPA: NADH-quinone oxidoreductase subunit NuoN [Alphaproteobacteria bacterium]|nr:NADH-quinone oxidoreductase subunit NuoN [Alphaproteobacteria bacterium]